MSRYRAYSRRQLRVRLWVWIGGNKRLLALTTVGLLLLLTFETFILLRLVPSSPVRWYVLGAVHVGLCAAFVHLLNAAFLAHDHEAILDVRGAWGEENTRDELARAKRKRLIWGWIDSVTLQNGDIDHLVVTRTGGLIAIDSKFRTVTNPGDRDAMARSAQKMRLRAEAVVRTLLSRERGSHRSTANTQQVTPLLVIWGPVQHHVPSGAVVDGVEVVGGRRLTTWLKDREGEAIDKAAARDVLARLERFRSTAWDAGRPAQRPG